MSAQVDDRHLRGVAGARRRLLEQEGDSLAGQDLRGRIGQGEGEDAIPPIGVEIIDVEEVGHGGSPSLPV